jgi:hypothetical protein
LQVGENYHSLPLAAIGHLPHATLFFPTKQAGSTANVISLPWSASLLPHGSRLPLPAPSLAEHLQHPWPSFPFPLLFPCAQRLLHGRGYLCSNHGASLCCPRRAAQQPSAFPAPRARAPPPAIDAARAHPMGTSPAPRQPAWSLVSSPMAPSSFPSLFQIGIRAVRAKLSQPWTAPSLRSLHPLAERPCCVPPACNAHLPACVLLRSAHWRLLGVRQNAQQVARCSSPPVRSPLPSSRVVALVLAAQPHPRRRKSSVRFLAALAAIIFFCAR